MSWGQRDITTVLHFPVLAMAAAQFRRKRQEKKKRALRSGGQTLGQDEGGKGAHQLTWCV